MAKTLSADLRSRVIAAVEAGGSRWAVADRFGIGVATVIRWVRVFRAAGAIAALPKGGDLRSQRIEAFRDLMLGAIKAQKDITLSELAAMLVREQGAAFAPSTVHRFLARRRVLLKKSRARRRARQVGLGPTQAGLARRAA